MHGCSSNDAHNNLLYLHEQTCIILLIVWCVSRGGRKRGGRRGRGMEKERGEVERDGERERMIKKNVPACSMEAAIARCTPSMTNS